MQTATTEWTKYINTNESAGIRPVTHEPIYWVLSLNKPTIEPYHGFRLDVEKYDERYWHLCYQVMNLGLYIKIQLLQ